MVSTINNSNPTRMTNASPGSYGAPPLPVLDAVHEIEKEIESNPDLFMRVKLKSRLDAVRHRLAGFIGAENDEIVLVQNATTGINITLHNFRWRKDDILVGCKCSLSTPQSQAHPIQSPQRMEQSAISCVTTRKRNLTQDSLLSTSLFQVLLRPSFNNSRTIWIHCPSRRIIRLSQSLMLSQVTQVWLFHGKR
jgi:hypothetical protein